MKLSRIHIEKGSSRQKDEDGNDEEIEAVVVVATAATEKEQAEVEKEEENKEDEEGADRHLDSYHSTVEVEVCVGIGVTEYVAWPTGLAGLQSASGGAVG